MNTELTPQVAWEDFVGKAINDLKLRHPTLNLSQIAMRINLNRSTLNRIINEGIKPQLDNYIKIIVGSGNSETLSSALTAYDETLIGESSNISINQTKTFSPSVKLEAVLEDGNNYIVYMLSMKDNGTTLDEVFHVLGNRGAEAVDKLLELKIIELDGTSIKSNIKNQLMITTKNTAKNRIKLLNQFYKVEHFGKQRNYFHTITAGLNNDGVLKMQNLHREFHQKMIEIVTNGNNQGDIPMFSAAFCDSFTSINYNFNKELKL